MAKRLFILRVRSRGGEWTWVNLDRPMSHHAANQYAMLNRFDGLSTQIWPENEAREIIKKPTPADAAP